MAELLPLSTNQKIAMLVGVAMILVGTIGIWVGVKPIVDLVGPTFSGGAPPSDLGERLDAAMTGAVAPAGGGFAAALAGFIVFALAKERKERPIDEIVDEKVTQRLAEAGLDTDAPATTPSPAAAPAATPVPTPAPTPSPVPAGVAEPMLYNEPANGPPRCGICDSMMLAAGTICPKGH